MRQAEEVRAGILNLPVLLTLLAADTMVRAQPPGDKEDDKDKALEGLKWWPLF